MADERTLDDLLQGSWQHRIFPEGAAFFQSPGPQELSGGGEQTGGSFTRLVSPVPGQPTTAARYDVEEARARRASESVDLWNQIEREAREAQMPWEAPRTPATQQTLQQLLGGGSGGGPSQLPPGVRIDTQGRVSYEAPRAAVGAESAPIQARALELQAGGMPAAAAWRQAAQEQTAQVAIPRAGGTAEAAAKGRRAPGVPLSPQERLLYPGSETYSDIGGKAPSTPAEREKVMAVSTSEGLIDQLEAMAEQVITASGSVKGTQQKITGTVSSFIPGTAERLYSQTRDAFTGQLARSLGSERGVLTDRDIIRVGAALPDFGDTIETRQIKFTILRNMLAMERAAKQAIIQGTSPEGVSAAYRPRIEALLQSLQQLPRAAQSSGGVELRRDAQGNLYRRGPDGTPQRVNP